MKKENSSKKTSPVKAGAKTTKRSTSAAAGRPKGKIKKTQHENVESAKARPHQEQVSELTVSPSQSQEQTVDLQASRKFWMAVLGAVVVILVAVQSYGYLTGWGNPQKVIDRHFNQAQRLGLAKRYAAAIRQYKKVTTIKSAGEEVKQQAWVGIADLYREQKAWSKAIAYYQQLQQQAPKSVMAAWAGLKIGECQVESGQAGQALATYMQISKAYPASDWDAEARLGQGQAYEALNQYQKAIRVYQSLEKEYHGGFLAAEAMIQTGHCYERLGNKDKARAIYRDVMTRYPDTMADEAKQHLQKLSYTPGPRGIRNWEK